MLMNPSVKELNANYLFSFYKYFKEIKISQMIESHRFSYVYEINDKYAIAFSRYLRNKVKRRKQIKFKKVKH